MGEGEGEWEGGLETAEILLAESCDEQVNFESGFKQRKGRRISEMDGREFQTGGARRLKERSPKVLVLRFLWHFEELLTR